MRLAFIGLGNMGAPMAHHLLSRGFDVTVFDMKAEARSAFGERSAQTAAQAARDADIIITMLPNGDVVRDALLGPEGALRDAPSGKIVVDMSSSDAGGTADLGKDLAALGVPLIDAPVSGGVALAGQGKLAIMIGSNDAVALDKARPALEALGDRILEVGPLGAGHAAKAINNVIAAGILALTSEGLLMGQRFGVDPAKILDVLNSSTGRSGVSETIFKSHILPRNFSLGFAIGLMAKDAGLATSLAKRLDLDLPMIERTSASWSDARDGLGATEDFTAYLKHVEATNGGDPIA